MPYTRYFPPVTVTTTPAPPWPHSHTFTRHTVTQALNLFLLAPTSLHKSIHGFLAFYARLHTRRSTRTGTLVGKPLCAACTTAALHYRIPPHRHSLSLPTASQVPAAQGGSAGRRALPGGAAGLRVLRGALVRSHLPGPPAGAKGAAGGGSQGAAALHASGPGAKPAGGRRAWVWGALWVHGEKAMEGKGGEGKSVTEPYPYKRDTCSCPQGPAGWSGGHGKWE